MSKIRLEDLNVNIGLDDDAMSQVVGGVRLLSNDPSNYSHASEGGGNGLSSSWSNDPSKYSYAYNYEDLKNHNPADAPDLTILGLGNTYIA